MADSNTQNGTAGERVADERGWPAVKALLFLNKYDSALWLLRLYAIGCTLFFIVPLLGFQFSRVFFQQLVQEDAFHYLAYSILFLMANPATQTVVLIPITMFAIMHAAAFSRKIIEATGSEGLIMQKLRAITQRVENRESQQAMLQFIASSEIMMMPVTILMLFSGQASFLVPFFYYRFVQLRYTSRRNPYSRLMFQQMRLGIERIACHPKCPAIAKRILFAFTGLISRLSPAVQPQPA